MSKIQHLTLFLLKDSIKDFAGALKTGTSAGNPTALTNPPFEGALYLPAPIVNPPGWLAFVKSGVPAADVQENRIASALLFVKAAKRLFVFTFGHARHFLDSESLVRDFGLRVVVNSVDKDKIRGVRLRVLKETAVKRQEEAAKGTGLRTFDVDTEQDLLRGVSGVPEDTKLALRISGADSLAFDGEIAFGDLAAKREEMLNAYKAKAYSKRGFEWIDNLKAVRSSTVVDQLDKSLVDALKARHKEVQLLLPDGINRDLVRGFLYKEEKTNAEKHSELEISDWRTAVGAELTNLTVEKLRRRRIRAFDENGSLAWDFADRDCFVFETVQGGAKYVLSNGAWFEVSKSFDDLISGYIKGISKSPIALIGFEKTWLSEKQKEAKYVEEAAKKPDLMSLHTKNFTIGGNAVEPCDLLHRTGALIHVKVWAQSATFSHLLAQAAVSAESLLRYPAFRNHVANLATKHDAEIKALFPTDGFTTSKLDVVLALITKQKELPFFSRLNLMREGQRIERLGFKVHYHRVEVK
jgi:uncharacterized protein (TIGR04141 family)